MQLSQNIKQMMHKKLKSVCNRAKDLDCDVDGFETNIYRLDHYSYKIP
jgi:hypothetical protein